ncbi:EAL domain-containing protein [Bradyrhizobium sp. dw_78]|uniref:putative bifunctional diguanylate cyclase/phosphodiesterase n=1 Tax=Bradyrhizobium sp. dw_78 TaxID=2719793 RepID=UPI00201BFD3E|nr:EAL domain-containing protein [Bradyrhizobium sp. dw_78]
MALPSDNPDLVKAQCTALSSLIPLMYFILVASSWVLAIDYLHAAPLWLTVYCPLVLTIICAVRLTVWWRKRGVVLTTETAIHELRRTNRMAGILAVGFPAWALALFPYGDAFAQSYVAFFLAISVIGCVFCLTHLRSAVLIITAVVTTIFVGFFALTENPTFIAMAVNFILVMAAVLVVVLMQSRDFNRLVVAQAEAMALIAENQRKQQEQYRLLRMIDDMPVAVMTVDPATFNINYVNETSKQTLSRIEGLLPIKADELLGASIDIFHRHPEHQRRLLSNPGNLPHRARIKLGPEMLDLQISAVNATDGSYIGPMLTWSIVTQQVEAENRIRELAHYDTLTGLANRTTFREQLELSLAKPGSRVGLLFIDLDGFKIVNDSMGHLVGDALLKQVANRLRDECRQPSLMVGRLGGDEFGILMEEGDPDAAPALAGRLVDALVAPYHLELDRRVQIGASIGIAVAPLHGNDAEILLSRADIALYAAKAAGKGTSRMFSPELELRIQERVRLEGKLRVALEEENGLFVFYQPIVDIQTGRITAREALLRWYNPQRGWISPGEFIPVAEGSGLIDKLGLFVLNRACRDAAEWTDGARVAVNVSPGQLGKGTLAPAILTALVESGLSPGRLEIEVTESALLNDVLDCIADLRQARDMGVRVALDDFGTGFSSLAHLRAFPFDKIKIDGSFVRDAVKRPDCAAVVKVVADLGKRLGVTTVAEGVETQAHLERVTEEGCSEVQGYLFGRPAPSERDAPIVAEIQRQLAEKAARDESSYIAAVGPSAMMGQR